MNLPDDELLRRWKRLNSCHFVDLKLRKDGQDIIEQGDWIKRVIREVLERRGAIKIDNLEYLEQKELEHYLRQN